MKGTDASSNALTLAKTDAKLIDAGTSRNQNRKLRIGREQMARLHEAQDQTVNALGVAKDMAAETANSGSNVLSKAFVGLRDNVKSGVRNNNFFSKIGLGALGTVLGLKGVRSGMELVKSIFTKNVNGSKGANILFAGGQTLFGGALAVGLFRTVMGTPGMFGLGSITMGLIGFALLSLLKSNYQDQKGFGSRILGLAGVGDTANGLVDSLALNSRPDNEVLR